MSKGRKVLANNPGQHRMTKKTHIPGSADSTHSSLYKHSLVRFARLSAKSSHKNARCCHMARPSNTYWACCTEPRNAHVLLAREVPQSTTPGACRCLNINAMQHDLPGAKKCRPQGSSQTVHHRSTPPLRWHLLCPPPCVTIKEIGRAHV